jgi:four helix bundle protein
MTPHFDHEKLRVYQAAISFNEWAGELLAEVTRKAAVKDQFDRATTSVPLNVAEGNAKFSSRDRARFFDIARGSALEAAACLDVLVSRRLIRADHADAGKSQLFEIVNMLMGLLRRLGYAFGSAMVREGEEYEHEQEKGGR